jgi:hypothetical protein
MFRILFGVLRAREYLKIIIPKIRGRFPIILNRPIGWIVKKLCKPGLKLGIPIPAKAPLNSSAIAGRFKKLNLSIKKQGLLLDY